MPKPPGGKPGYIARKSGDIIVGIWKPAKPSDGKPAEGHRIVYRGWSWEYANRVARKWAKAGYTSNVERIQQEEM